MKFKIDENLPIEIANLLDENGHDAMTVHQENLTGIVDNELANICQDKHTLMKFTRRVLPLLSIESLQGHLWILDEMKLRIRD